MLLRAPTLLRALMLLRRRAVTIQYGSECTDDPTCSSSDDPPTTWTTLGSYDIGQCNPVGASCFTEIPFAFALRARWLKLAGMRP